MPAVGILHYLCYTLVRMTKLKSTITSKGQTTVPKTVRHHLRAGTLSPLFWEIADGKVSVTAAEPGFFRFFGSIHVGRGSVVEDVRRARRIRGT